MNERKLIIQSTSQPINQLINQLANYTLHLADNNLILTQRNGDWCGHGPILEQDIAITNITLDLIGQARNFYQYAASLINTQSELQGSKVPPKEGFREASEDTLAYLRKEREFKNCLLVEQQNGDWAQTILRQFFYSVYQYLLYEKMQHSKDAQLASIAAKAIKEVKYHVTWSSEWVIRLSDGTVESKTRMEKAINELWRYTGELFVPAPYEKKMIEAGIAPNVEEIKNDWLKKVEEVFAEATLKLPEGIFMQTGGKTGIHTESFGFMLAEMQYLQRAYPGAEW